MPQMITEHDRPGGNIKHDWVTEILKIVVSCITNKTPICFVQLKYWAPTNVPFVRAG